MRSSATGRSGQGPTCLDQAAGGKNGHVAPKLLARKRVDVVEVHHAVGRHSVGRCCQIEFGYEAPTSPGERGDHDGSDAVRDRVAGEHEDRTVAAWGRRKPDVTALHRPSPTSL